MERMKREKEKKEGRGENPDKPEKSDLFFFPSKEKKTGNKQSAKKCFPESLRNFKVCVNPFRQ